MAVAIDTGNILTNGGNAAAEPLAVGTLTIGAGVNFVLIIIAQNGTAGTDTATVNGVSATLWGSNPGSGGGYSDISVLSLVNPTAGAVSIGTGNSRIKAVAVIPFSGVNTADPLGTWVAPGDTDVTSPSTGTITGVDSSGLFIGALSIYDVSTVTSDGTFSAVADYLQDADVRAHVASKAGAASATYNPTLSAGLHSNPIGVYVKAASGGGSSVAPLAAYYSMQQ
jgi:hypothetical protein